MMIKRFVNWFFSPSTKPLMEDPVAVDELYQRLAELEARVKVLEEENTETTNCLYELMNSTEAIDRRIDILFGEFTK